MTKAKGVGRTASKGGKGKGIILTKKKLAFYKVIRNAAASGRVKIVLPSGQTSTTLVSGYPGELSTSRYNWGPKGIPAGKPFRYVEGKGWGETED